MKTFSCQCGNRLHFENYQCMVCGRELGFLPDVMQLSSLEPAGDGLWAASASGATYRKCRNYSKYAVCNWMVPAAEDQPYCFACRLDRVIPNLSEEGNLVLWSRIEAAKRRLLFGLAQLGLPIVDRRTDPGKGLAFEFKEDPQATSEFINDVAPGQHVVTGHDTGVITLNIMEAEPSARERMREKMNERYRTLLGHFRHEIGHYYWGLLVAVDPAWLAEFRQWFGDEQRNYRAALSRYYRDGPAGNWQVDYVSPYASAHPWEDWAETWAHYLHMVDTLETAEDFGFHPGRAGSRAFEDLMEDWAQLAMVLNALNRSMGMEDAYPFALSGRAVDKLRFVHRLIHSVSS